MAEGRVVPPYRARKPPIISGFVRSACEQLTWRGSCLSAFMVDFCNGCGRFVCVLSTYLPSLKIDHMVQRTDCLFKTSDVSTASFRPIDWGCVLCMLTTDK